MTVLRKTLLAASLATFFLGRSALAYPEYPTALEEAGALSCKPSCIVCHDSEVGSQGTATQDFVGTMLMAGLGQDDSESVAVAWNALGNADTDGDGATDQEELVANPPSSPNDASSTPDEPGDGAGRCGGETEYGCGAQLAAPSGTPFGSAWALLAALGVSIGLRRRRRALR